MMAISSAAAAATIAALSVAATASTAADKRVFLYWANAGGITIGRSNLDGTGLDERFVADAGAAPCGVAVDAHHVYWAEQEAAAIGRANLDGKDVNREFITLPPRDSPCGVAVSGGHLYWATGYTGRYIGRANINGTHVEDHFIAAAHPCGVIVHGAYVYWGSYNYVPFSKGVSKFRARTVGRAKLDGTHVARAFIRGANNPCGVAVDKAHLYWANFNGFTIGRADLNGDSTNQRLITSTGPDPCGVAVYNGFIYWADSGDTTIRRSSLSGRAHTRIVTPQAFGACGVAVG
jgi:hypothetical protein